MANAELRKLVMAGTYAIFVEKAAAAGMMKKIYEPVYLTGRDIFC